MEGDPHVELRHPADSHVTEPAWEQVLPAQSDPQVTMALASILTAASGETLSQKPQLPTTTQLSCS